jgi:hypothetical protein
MRLRYEPCSVIFVIGRSSFDYLPLERLIQTVSAIDTFLQTFEPKHVPLPKNPRLDLVPRTLALVCSRSFKKDGLVFNTTASQIWHHFTEPAIGKVST